MRLCVKEFPTAHKTDNTRENNIKRKGRAAIELTYVFPISKVARKNCRIIIASIGSTKSSLTPINNE